MVQLDRFASEAIADEADRLGVSIEELTRFAVLYYLADLDSGRIARGIPGPSQPPHWWRLMTEDGSTSSGERLLFGDRLGRP